jgi:hypothetical protein
MGVVSPHSDDEPRREDLLAALQRTSRVIHGPGGSARIVTLSHNALANG